MDPYSVMYDAMEQRQADQLAALVRSADRASELLHRALGDVAGHTAVTVDENGRFDQQPCVQIEDWALEVGRDEEVVTALARELRALANFLDRTATN